MDHDPLPSEIGEVTRNPLDLRVLSLETLGWRVVPIYYVDDSAGTVCLRTSREFLPADDLELGFESDFACYVAEDWRFSTIFVTASKRPSEQKESDSVQPDTRRRSARTVVECGKPFFCIR